MKQKLETKIIILSVTMQVIGFIGFAILQSGRMANSYLIEILSKQEKMQATNQVVDSWENFNTGVIANSFLIFGIIGFIILVLTILINPSRSENTKWKNN